MRTTGTTDWDLLKDLLDQHLGSPFSAKDRKFRYVAANRAMAQLCGLTTGRELIGRQAREVFCPELGRRFELLDAEVLNSGRPLRNVLEMTVSKDGARTWLLSTRLPLRDRNGVVVGLAAHARQLPSGNAHEASYRRAQAASEHLRHDFGQQVLLGATAARIGTSMQKLESDFRKVFRMTPSAFLNSVRIEHAKTLLADEGISIANVAVSCGYRNHSSFSRRFLKEVGMPPLQFRQSERLFIRASGAAARGSSKAKRQRK